DLVMPEMDGSQFLSEIVRSLPALPVVVISAQGNDQIAARSLEMGAVNYVPKRRLADDLVPALDDVLRARREAQLSQEVMRHVRNNRARFRIEGDLEQIRSLINLIHDRLTGLERLTDEAVQQLTAMVRESLLNAYYHGCLEVNPGPLQHAREAYLQLAEERRRSTAFATRQIELELIVTDHCITFRIADNGPGFDHQEAGLLAHLEAAEASMSDRGSGLRMIRHRATTMQFNPAGNQITFSLNANRKSSETNPR
ncbi:MAG: ATP-binding protein, partial [Planctomycetaceae bacterium]|nr:ATP-binding protein [Planctomycetaceae bacterium]